MKIEIEKDFPQYFKPAYPEEFELFSHFEVTAGIPTVLFAVTTWKENGKPNVCFHSWSCFHGDIEYVHPIMEHSWGQRVVRFYDPDKHIIEVGENMKVVCKRFLDSGMTPEQVAKRMDVPMKFVNACMR